MLELLERHAAFHPLDNVHTDDRPFFEQRHQQFDQEVKQELRRLKDFAQFKRPERGILHARLDVRHRIEDMLVSHYLQRFPGHSVVLESGRGIFIGEGSSGITRSEAPLGEVIASLQEKRPLMPEQPVASPSKRFLMAEG
ncbi:MAG: DUF4130 domain-containing protein [Nanoarchaeota archaeon]